MALMIFFVLLSFITLIILAVSVYNFVTKPELKQGNYDITSNHLLSILIPARNEEKNIGSLLESLSGLPDINYEVIVLNDNSTDKTGEIVSKAIDKERRIKLLNGGVLPQGWLGKNYACFQLSRAARGEYLLFLDADVRLLPQAIPALIYTLRKEKSVMLSVFPTQIMETLGEQLVVPLMNWILLSFLPLKFVRSSANPKFVAANGQCIFITRSVYNAVGGHEAFKDNPVEDMALARLLKRKNFPIVTLLGGALISCRMYTDFRSAVEGFTKNFYRGFELPAPAFIGLLLFIYAISIYPLVLSFYYYPFAGLYFLHLLAYSFISRAGRQNVIRNTILAPIQFLTLQFVGIRSLLYSLAGKLEWKGRKLV